MLLLLLIWYLRGVLSGYGKMLLSHIISGLILIQVMMDHKGGGGCLVWRGGAECKVSCTF